MDMDFGLDIIRLLRNNLKFKPEDACKLLNYVKANARMKYLDYPINIPGFAN